MSLDVLIGGKSVAGILSGPPAVTDSMDAVCRVLDIQAQAAAGLDSKMGQIVELWRNGTREFYGTLRRLGKNDSGALTYRAYDPLFFFKSEDDYYFRNMTAGQIFRELCSRIGVTVGRVENTGAVFPQLFYRGTAANTVQLDTLSRTFQANQRKFWYRFNPDAGDDFGATLFERKIPTYAWAFQRGVNLTSTSLEESIEDAYTRVKLVNRETGKVVVKTNDQAVANGWGILQKFQEVDKDHAPRMESQAAEMLGDLSKVNVRMDVEGVNPGIMPALYTGDVVYVEEEAGTGMLGAYHIRSITQTYQGGGLVLISMQVQSAPEVPPIQVDNATEDPDKKKETTGR